MSAFNITYIIATRNRLPFVKITLERLLNNVLPGEEIVVVDGNSTDGAKEYLQQLFEQGKIHQFISEPDRNQAHAWNKALLMAKGTIIKKIIDDDVYNYAAIRKCSNYMLNTPDVDLCISNCLSTNLQSPNNIYPTSRLPQYTTWKKGETASFTFSDVSMLIRRSALSYLGLYDTQFIMLDWEYALRCSYLKANIAYYTGFVALTVDRPGNITSSTTTAQLKAEGLIGKQKYGYAGDRSDISAFSEMKIAIGKVIYKAKKVDFNNNESVKNTSPEELSQIYDGLYKHLENHDNSYPGNFV